MTRERFDAWWLRETASRVSDMSTSRRGRVTKGVEIRRDRWGVPHVFAHAVEDLMFGLGFAMAQDRLWQLDYFRRKAVGRLAEIVGSEALQQDIQARTIGFNRIANDHLPRLPGETLRLLTAFTAGVNGVIEESSGRLPIEFELLGYQPEPWTPLDCLAIWVDKRWYSSGRLHVSALPEVARRRLGDDLLYRAFLTPEADDESILPDAAYLPGRDSGLAAGATVGDPGEGHGSNNWAVAGSRTVSGVPMLASDPHNAFGMLNERYEFHLCGGGRNSAGTALLGVPAANIGRNERVAWGLTNNTCSQRDLYLERESSEHSGCFLYDGRWEPATELVESIEVRGGKSVDLKVRSSRNGPIVDSLLPAIASGTGPVSLRWLGASFSDEIGCLIEANRAASCSEFREALRGWLTPTWNFVFADVDGHIGYQCAGSIPVRRVDERGYRPGWDPVHQWQGTIPFEGMPRLDDPSSGIVISANNRVAPADFPYPLAGAWNSGYRARRIRQLLSRQAPFEGAPLPVGSDESSSPPPGFALIQSDLVSLRALQALPPLLDALGEAPGPRGAAAGPSGSGLGSNQEARATAEKQEPLPVEAPEEEKAARLAEAVELLAAWDGHMGPASAAASIFEAFFRQWTLSVAAARFSAGEAGVLAGAMGGLALELLSSDTYGWFESAERRRREIQASMARALDELEARLGPGPKGWAWGRIHTLTLRHPISGRGELGELLDRGPYPLGGSLSTVANAAYDTSYAVSTGATFRVIADLAEADPGLWAANAAGQSGQPGSGHYGDQAEAWLQGRYHRISLCRRAADVEGGPGFDVAPL